MSISLYPTPSEHNLRYFNKRASLDLIRFTPGGISRAELARQMGLTRSALTIIVNDLMQNGLVREAEDGPATGGRRAILLEINPRRGYVAGIDMGATHLGIVIADFAARVVDEIETPFNIQRDPRVCLENLVSCLKELLVRNGLTAVDVLSVGVGVPGPVVAEAGLVTAPPIMPGWDGFPIRDWLQERLGCPISIHNDADLGALGEWSHGTGRGERNLAYIKVGSGVGAGLLLDGKIYLGATGSAGEIGHITIREDGPLCTCGNYGCLEAMAGGAAIAEQARAAVASGKRTQLALLTSTAAITAKEVAAAAQKGDLVAQQIMSEAGSYLGIAVASLVNLFDPGMVVVGGGVAQIGDLLLEPIRQAVRVRSLKSVADTVRITAAVLGRRSTSMGAVVQALNIAMDRLMESV